MKKLLLVLLTGLLAFPTCIDAKIYRVRHAEDSGTIPRRVPALYQIGVDIDSESGDLYVTPNYDLTGLTITLTGGGATYINTTVSLTAGQSYTDTLAGYDEGTYILTLSTADGVIAQYEITVEAD